jgi:hypothetical protein
LPKPDEYAAITVDIRNNILLLVQIYAQPLRRSGCDIQSNAIATQCSDDENVGGLVSNVLG